MAPFTHTLQDGESGFVDVAIEVRTEACGITLHVVDGRTLCGIVLQEGRLRLVVFADAGSEFYTHQIDLGTEFPDFDACQVDPDDTDD